MPVFYLVGANDPWFDAAGQYAPDIKCSMLKYLLTQGLEVNIYNHENKTPLISAITGKNLDAALLLVGHFLCICVFIFFYVHSSGPCLGAGR